MGSDDDSDVERKDELDYTYLSDFKKHLSDARAHLDGNTNDQDDEDEDEEDEEEDRGGDSYWTVQEKNAFFHALSVHSRFRPDMIAACIGTKTVVDVCVYIDALDEAARCTYDDDDICYDRNDFECAIEVSDDWIVREEMQAALLLAQEPIWAREDREKAREAETLKRKRELWEEMGDLEDEHGKKRWKQEFRKWRHHAEQQRKKEDALEHLNEWHLRRMATILKSVSKAAVDGGGDDEEDMDEGGDEVPSQTLPPPDIFIPPIPMDIDPEHSTQRNPDIGSSQPQPESQDTASSGNEEEMDPDDIAATMSPRSRRRYKKMIHMRRKRGITSVTADRLLKGRKAKLKHPPPVVERRGRPRNRKEGEEEEEAGRGVDDSDGEGETNGAAADGSSRQPTSSQATPSASQSSQPANEKGEYRSKNVSGSNFSLKAKKVLDDCHVTSDTLREDGLGLFHLNRLAGIINIHSYVYSDPSEPDVASEISGPCISLLEAYVVEFCEQVVKLAIFNRDSEITAKKTKAWHLEGEVLHEVTPANVMHALKRMEAQRSRQSYLKKLLQQDIFGDVDMEHDDDEEANEVLDGDMSVLQDDHPAQPHHRDQDVLPILHPLPNCLSVVHPALPPPPPRIALKKPQPEFMADTTDEELLEDELEEEDDLNRRDEREARKAEEYLWLKSTS